MHVEDVTGGFFSRNNRAPVRTIRFLFIADDAAGVQALRTGALGYKTYTTAL